MRVPVLVGQPDTELALFGPQRPRLQEETAQPATQEKHRVKIPLRGTKAEAASSPSTPTGKVPPAPTHGPQPFPPATPPCVPQATPTPAVPARMEMPPRPPQSSLLLTFAHTLPHLCGPPPPRGSQSCWVLPQGRRAPGCWDTARPIPCRPLESPHAHSQGCLSSFLRPRLGECLFWSPGQPGPPDGSTTAPAPSQHFARSWPSSIPGSTHAPQNGQCPEHEHPHRCSASSNPVQGLAQSGPPKGQPRRSDDRVDGAI